MSVERKDSTATLLAMTAARQALSTTSVAQARMDAAGGGPAPSPGSARVALFAAAGRAGVRGSFAPEAAALIGQEHDR